MKIKTLFIVALLFLVSCNSTEENEGICSTSNTKDFGKVVLNEMKNFDSMKQDDFLKLFLTPDQFKEYGAKVCNDMPDLATIDSFNKKYFKTLKSETQDRCADWENMELKYEGTQEIKCKNSEAQFIQNSVFIYDPTNDREIELKSTFYVDGKDYKLISVFVDWQDYLKT